MKKIAPHSGKTSALRFAPHNARRHGERNKQVIREALTEVGPLRSIGVDGDGIVRAGNGVLEQAQQLGLNVRIVDARPDELIAVRRKDLKGERAERAELYDNRASDLAEWDPEVLKELAAQRRELLEGLFDEGELQALFARMETEPTHEPADVGALLDQAAALQKKWKTAEGQLWEIPSRTVKGGAHRMLCGDATKADDIARLMVGSKGEPVQAALVFTSPPYWVGKEYERQKSVEDIEAFIRSTCAAMMNAVRKDESRIVINTGMGFTTSFNKRKKRQVLLLLDKWTNALFDLGWNLRHVRHWIKEGQLAATAPKTDLIDQHCEFLGAYEADAGKPLRFDDVLNEQDVSLLATFYNPQAVSRGMRRTGQTWALRSYWNDLRGAATRSGHTASFPLQLPGRHLMLYTQPGESVLDVFLGSGTTIVAAELLGRLGYGMEQSPEYCAVALERLKALGLTPTLVKERANPMKAR